MKRIGPSLLLVGVLVIFAVGLAWLFRLRIAQGDVFPVYSTLRADPLGTRALHDSLARLPGLQVERRLKPFSGIAPTPVRALLVVGMTSEQWTRLTAENFRALDQAVRQGSRLVIALRAQVVRKADESETSRRAARKVPEEERVTGVAPEYVNLHQQWGVAVRTNALAEGLEPARRTVEAPGARLPEQVTWRSEAYLEFDDNAGWAVMYRRGGQPVLATRTHGRGTIVLASDAYFLSNEALQRQRATGLLAWIVGPHGHVVFEEAHLGVMMEPGVAALARHYGLAGALFTLLLLAGLFVWRRTALFVPPADSQAEVALAYHPAAGLEALLRRSVPAKDLVTTCLTEWKSTAAPGRWAQVETALAAQPAATAVARYNVILRALRRR